MKINVNNTGRVGAALATVQDGCTARTYDAAGIMALARRAETELASAGIPAYMRNGAKTHGAAGSVAKSYRGSPECTTVQLVRGSSWWFLVHVGRTQAPRGAYGRAQCFWLSVPFHPDMLASMLRAHAIEIMPAGGAA